MDKPEDQSSESAQGGKPPRLEPPTGLTYEDEIKWFDEQIAMAEMYQGIFTERYFKESKGKLIEELEIARRHASIGHKAPPKTSEEPEDPPIKI